MDRLTARERAEVLDIIAAEAPDLSRAQAAAFLDKVEPWAIALHTLYEAACNRPLRRMDQHRQAFLERSLREEFEQAGLGLYLNGDPRGNPVGILTPISGRSNTMGGRECGWRL